MSDNLTLPPRYLKSERAMGRFMILWAVMEQHIDNVMAVTLDIGSDLNMCLTSTLGFKAKTDILVSLANQLNESDNDWSEKLVAVTNKLVTMSGFTRNYIAHGQPIKVNFTETKHKWFWSKFHTRKSIQGRAHRLDDHVVWQNETNNLKKLISELASIHKVRLEWLETLGFEARGEIYGYRDEVIQLNLEVDRTRRPQATHDSKVRQSKK